MLVSAETNESPLSEVLPNVTHVPVDGGTTYAVLGHHTNCLLSKEQTGGAFSLIRTTIPPGDGPPPHIHSREDESFYVLEGQLTVFDEGKTLVVGPGEVIFAPRGHAHTFVNMSDQQTTILVIAAPGGIENFFKDMSQMPAGPPDIGRILAIGQDHQIAYVLPSQE